MTRARWIALGVGAALVGAAALAWIRPASGPTVDPRIEAGKRLYREGRLTSGAPVPAVTMGDVPFDGAACASCHGRSGMGTGEGGQRTPPLAAPVLFAPEVRHRRPAYTEQTLARAIVAGVDAGGRPLDPLMPRFRLEPADVDALVAYLATLGAAPSPGVDERSLHVATVIAGDVPDARRRAVEGLIEAYVTAKNAEIRNDRERAAARRAPGEAVDPYRDWAWSVWELSGGPADWPAQLAARYDAQPVFALIGGLAAGPWEPIDRFCEASEVPCLFPSTELPPAEPGAYSRYYSGGARLEGRIVAADLAAQGLASDVLVLVPPGGADDVAAVTAAEVIRAGGGSARIVELALGSAAPVDGASAVVAWLADLTGVDLGGSAPVYVSASRVGRGAERIPGALRPRARAVDLLRATDDRDAALERFRTWARSRDLDPDEEWVEAQTWFACLAFLDGSKHVGRYPQRDYLLDSLDHAGGLTALLPGYPRGAVAPGQRFLAKGGRVVQLADGAERWVVPP